MKNTISNILILLGLVSLTLPSDTDASSLQKDAKSGLDRIVIRGEISSAQGPIVGAGIRVFREAVVATTQSNVDGHFQFELDPHEPVHILVLADGMLSQIRTLETNFKSKLEIQLEEQESPLNGRIIDSQGMSVTNANLRVTHLRHNSSSIKIPEDLKIDRFVSRTDRTGTFHLDGIEQAMVGTIKVTGQSIVSSALNRESFNDEIVLVAQPARIVKGKVVDRLTKQSLSNVVVSLVSGEHQVQVDDSGAFELKGLPAFRPLLLQARPQGEQPFLSNTITVPVEHGFDPVEVEIDLEPGVRVDCKVKVFGSDRLTNADIFYFPTPENKDFRSYVESFLARGAAPSNSTNLSGDGKIVALPGPGVIAIVAPGFPPNESVNILSAEQRAMLQGITRRNDLTAVAWIEPKDLKDHVELSFLISKGREIKVELANSQLASMDDLVVHRAKSKNSYTQRVIGPKFVAEQFQPSETRQILIHAVRKNLGAVLNVKAEAKSPVQVELEPTGSVAGRIVDQNGDPQTGLSIQFEIRTDDGYQEIAAPVFTDANGRFEKPSLIAKLEYRVAAVRLTKNLRMMADAPVMDSRWYLAHDVIVNGNESVDFGTIVLGATDQPDRIRQMRTKFTANKNVLPRVISGRVINEAGTPVPDAIVTFNTWPNRSGDPKLNATLTPTVLAQSRSDSNGDFQMPIDQNLEKKIVDSNTDEGKRNAAIVVVAEKRGARQIQLQEILDPHNVNVQLAREMIVRGSISTTEDSGDIQLTPGSPMHIYDGDSIKQIMAGLRAGKSLENLRKKFPPVSTLDPLMGGIPLTRTPSASGIFRFRNIPLNAIFELHAIGETGLLNSITVISRPMRGFAYKPSENSPETLQLQGSRIKLELDPNRIAK